MSRVVRILVVGTVAWSTMRNVSFAQPAPTYSIDYQGPPRGAPPAATFLGGPVPCIKEGDILLAPFILPGPGPDPPPNPIVAITGGPRRAGANLGLPDDPVMVCPGPAVATGFEVEVDALSYGVDLLILPTGSRAFPVNMSFSVDEFAVGIPGAAVPPNVTSEGAFGTLEAAADVFIRLPGIMPGDPLPSPPFAVPPGDTQLFDGNGVAPPAAILPPLPCGGGPCALGLSEPLPPGPGLPDPCSNLDALDVDTLEPGAPPSPFPVYFSLDENFDDPFEGPAFAPPNSGSALGNFGASGAAVFIAFPSGVPALFAPGPALGLDIFGGFGTDDLDALALAENGDMVFQPSLAPFDWVDGSTDMLLFSVRRASVVIGLPDSCFGIPIAPGDVLTTPLAPALGGVSPFPCIFYAAENLGLATLRSGFGFNDDLDALDVSLDCNGNLIPDILDISYGLAPDVDGDKYIDFCCPALAAPMVGDDICFGGAFPGAPCSTDADCVGGVCGLKSRYISIVPPTVAPECPQLAIQVEIVSAKQCAGGANVGRGCETNAQCPGSTCVNSPQIGDIWWAGLEGSIANSPQLALRGSLLQCSATPANAQAWTTGVLHLYGTPIVPFASYNVRMCDAAGGNCSAPLLVATGEWGDIVSPFGGISQPAFGDINEVVFKFRNLGSSQPMPRVDLVGTGNPGFPNTPNQTANFADIGACVEGFRGIGYSGTIPACP